MLYVREIDAGRCVPGFRLVHGHVSVDDFPSAQQLVRDRVSSSGGHVSGTCIAWEYLNLRDHHYIQYQRANEVGKTRDVF